MSEILLWHYLGPPMVAWSTFCCPCPPVASWPTEKLCNVVGNNSHHSLRFCVVIRVGQFLHSSKLVNSWTLPGVSNRLLCSCFTISSSCCSLVWSSIIESCPRISKCCHYQLEICHEWSATIPSLVFCAVVAAPSPVSPSRYI